MRAGAPCVALWIVAFVVGLTNLSECTPFYSEIFKNATSPNLVWFIQLSDIHFSAYVPKRDTDMENFIPSVLKAVNPALVFITGDLTDAKDQLRRETRQDENEWKRYQEVLQHLSLHSGIPLARFVDIRGNHDTFEVPVRTGPLDWYSKYSVSAAFNRSATVQSFIFQDEDGKPRQQLVTVDTSPRRGLRGPSNFFGHPSDDDLSQLDAALAQSESDTWQVPRVVLGHYPLSFQAPSESGLKVQQVLSRRGVLAYFPGHLHYKFGRRLHRKLPGSFWEVELGDWKDNRAVRLFALDGGQLAFSDWLASGPLSSPLGLLTSPPSAHYPGLWSGSPNLVKVLAFNLPQESTLVAEVYRSEEEALTPGRGTPPLLSIPLESTLVMASSGRYMPVQFSSVLDSTALSSLAEGQDILWLRVSVGPTGQILCGPHPFSPSGTATSPLYRTWVERTVQGRQWASDWPSALGLSLVALCLASLLPWALHRGHLAHRDWPGPPLSLQEASKKVGTATLLDHTPPHRDDDVSADVSTSLLETSSAMQEASPVGSSRGSLLEAPGKWYLKMVGEYSRCPLWYLQVVSLLVICLGGPLFWGNPLGKHLSPASLSIWGWYLPPSDNASPPSFQGVPDILMIVLPYFILCFFPLTLWLPAWNGERLLRRHLAVMTADVAGKSGEERREVGEVGFRVLGLCGEEGKAFGGSLVRRRSFQEGSSGGGEKIEGEVVKGLKRGMEKVPNQFPGFRAPLLALRGGIWLSGLLVAYFNYWQIATMFHAYGKYVLLVSPGFAWFPVCALFYVWTHW